MRGISNKIGIGKKVVVYFDPDIEFAGNVVGGLRIKAHHGSTKVKGPGGSALSDMESDVPFRSLGREYFA